MKFRGGLYGYGPCPHIGGWKLGGSVLNVGDVSLACPAGIHPPFPPGCELQREFSG